MTPTLESLKRDAEGRQVNVSGWIATVFQDRHLPDQPLGLRSPGQKQTRLEWQQTLALAALLYGDDATLTYVVGRDHAGPKTITVPVIADPTFTWADAPQPD